MFILFDENSHPLQIHTCDNFIDMNRTINLNIESSVPIKYMTINPNRYLSNHRKEEIAHENKVNIYFHEVKNETQGVTNSNGKERNKGKFLTLRPVDIQYTMYKTVSSVGDLRLMSERSIYRIACCMEVYTYFNPCCKAVLSRELGLEFNNGRPGYIVQQIIHNYQSNYKKMIQDSNSDKILVMKNIAAKSIDTLKLDASDILAIGNQGIKSQPKDRDTFIKTVGYDLHRIIQREITNLVYCIYRLVSLYDGELLQAHVASHLGLSLPDNTGKQKDWVVHTLKHAITSQEIISLTPGRNNQYFRVGKSPETFLPPGRIFKYTKQQSWGEAKLVSLFNDMNIQFIHQYIIPECRYIKPLKFDFIVFMGNNIILIEIDGEQHRRYVEHFHKSYEGFLRSITKDKIKNTFSNLHHQYKINGINYNLFLLRISYENGKLEYSDEEILEWIKSPKKIIY